MLPFILLLAFATQASDDTEIRGLVRRYVDAREHQDARAVADLFTAEADQLVSSGEWRRGRDKVVEGTLASSRNASGKRTIEIETIRYISRDAAIADGRYEIAGGSDTRRMWSTFVMVREKGRWRISAIRNMLPAPPAR